MEKKTIGAFIAALRKANGLTQKQLAEKLNVSDKAVSRWERDECAPDLSLIPVLAEIFGVTCDELLRGERKAPDAPPCPTGTAKSEKQLKRLLTAAQTKFRIRSIITIAIAIMGVIAAAICNHGFTEATVGFMVGTIFYVAAIICQVIFLLLGLTAIGDEELDQTPVAACKRSMVILTEWILSAIALLFAGTLPLVTLSEGLSGFGISFGFCLKHGMLFALIGAVICLPVCYAVNVRIGYCHAPDRKSPKFRLRLRCAGILAIVLVILIFIHAIFSSFLSTNMHLYAECQQFDTFEEFKEYMETPVDPNGYPMTLTETIQEDYGYGEFTRYWYSSPSGEFELNEQGNTESLLYKDTPEGEEAFYTYLCLNLYVDYIETSDFGDVFPVYIFTADQYQSANSEGQLYTGLYSVLYALAVALTYTVYRKKLKKLQ